jgi:hypothetical protein
LDAAGLAEFEGAVGVEGNKEEGRCGGGQDEAGLALGREVCVRDLEVRGQRDKDVLVSPGEANIDRHCGRDAGASELQMWYRVFLIGVAVVVYLIYM